MAIMGFLMENTVRALALCEYYTQITCVNIIHIGLLQNIELYLWKGVCGFKILISQKGLIGIASPKFNQ